MIVLFFLEVSLERLLPILLLVLSGMPWEVSM